MSGGHRPGGEFRATVRQGGRAAAGRAGELLLTLEEAATTPSSSPRSSGRRTRSRARPRSSGSTDFSRVAHAMEDLLEQLRSGERMATPALIDGCWAPSTGCGDAVPAVLAGDDRAAPGRPPGRSPPTSRAAAPRTDARTRDADEPRRRPSPEPAPDAAPPRPARRRRRRDGGETVRRPARPARRADPAGRRVRLRPPAGRADDQPSGSRSTRPTIDEFRELSRLLNDLQERAMRARMVPVATITDVAAAGRRDVARATGKDVRWEVRGEDTELDRGVLQQLADPLLHLVRNAVDHGIESPDDALRGRQARAGDGPLPRHAARLRGHHHRDRRRPGHRRRPRSAREAGAAGARPRRGRRRGGARRSSSAAGSPPRRSCPTSRAAASGSTSCGPTSRRSGAGSRSAPSRVPAPSSAHRADHPGGAAVPARRGRRPAPSPSRCTRSSSAQAAGRPRTASEGRPVVWVGRQAVPVADLAATLGARRPRRRRRPDRACVAGLTRQHAFRVDALSASATSSSRA